MLPSLSLLLFAVGTAAAVPYHQYILAPSSRTIRPASVYLQSGSVSSEDALLDNGASTGGRLVLGAFNSSVTYDFGKNIAGWVNFNTTSEDGILDVTFSESSLWVSTEACDGTRGPLKLDAPMVFNITDAGHYAAPFDMERGAFRYLTLVNRGSDSLSIDDLWVHFTAMPHWAEDSLRDYTGWFNSDDEKLNRVWYAGAYTLQMITIDPTRGNAIAFADSPTNSDGYLLWWLNTTVSNGTSMLTDGAKRDRLAWSADMSVSVPGVAVTTFDLVSARNAFDAFFSFQNPDGRLPFGGYPVSLGNTTSFTYHVYALIGVWNVYHWGGDQAYVDEKWVQWKAGLDWAVAQIDDSGLANVSTPYDWLRFGQGGHNIEANTLLYYTLTLGVALARSQNDSATADRWSQVAAGVQSAAFDLLWQPDVGLFKDNETTTLSPQDGNTWAVKSGLVTNASQIVQISEALQARWGPYGAPSPEVDAVSPFISSIELETHFIANRTGAALELIRRMWHDFMLDDPRMTNSTLVEGFSMDGELHYPAYASDGGISHAHAFSTGPTSSLMTYVGGIQLLSGGGATWAIVPQVGDLKRVDAGFSTSLGVFSSKWSASGTVFRLEISTPKGTTGTVGLSFPGNYTSAILKGTDLDDVVVTADEWGKYWIEGLAGGDREFVVVGV